MYSNKKMFILGMARSGYEVAKVLSKHNCEILITDRKEQDENNVKELISLGVNYIVSDSPEDLLDNSYSYVVKNPGIKLDHPVCLKAKELGIPVINELEIAYYYLKKDVKIIGITGSNGKTTTSTMTYEMLKEANLSVKIGGNIGFPMCSLIDEINEGDILVLELSAQQLHDLKDFKADIAVLTNLTEVHLDHFNTYEYYKQMKKRVFNNSSLALINKDDEDVMALTEDVKNKKYFSTSTKSDIYVSNNGIYYNDGLVISLDDIRVKGMHNYQNAMCAILIAKEYNVSNEVIEKVLKNFKGVEHRLEFVKNINDRAFYNDSKATNVKSTQIALNSFNKPTILLLGGLDRGHSFDDLSDYLKNTKLIICYGETKNRIKEFADKLNVECFVVEDLEEAVKKSYDLSSKGDVILLSPACASWDQYKNFEERGTLFKQVVNSLG